MRCPVCDSDELEEGEMVDVGFGIAMGVKWGPDHCHRCGYIEKGPDPNDLPVQHYVECWKNGVDPHSRPQMKRAAPIREEYRKWIKENVGQDGGYGQCLKFAREMVAAFPELRIMSGGYYCTSWGYRGHFWCIDAEDNVVDPTSWQFPSRGGGIYEGQFLVDSEGRRLTIPSTGGIMAVQQEEVG